MIIGHIGFGIHNALPGPTKYIRMIRYSIKRTISNYLHMKRNQIHPLCDKLQKTSFEECLEQNMWIDANNGQARRLCKVENEYNAIRFGEVDKNMFVKAKNAIEKKFLAVGVMESFDKSLLLFKQLLGWRNIYYRRRYVASKKDVIELTSRANLIFNEYNQYDLKLYWFVKRRFETHCENINQVDVARFRSENETLSSFKSWLLVNRSECRRLSRGLKKRARQLFNLY